MQAPKTRREKKYTPKAQAEREPMPLNETLAMLWTKKKSLKK
jgi:hypothetical protein